MNSNAVPDFGGSFGGVLLERRLPDPPRGRHTALLVALQYHPGRGGNGVLVKFQIEGLGPTVYGYRIQLGGKFPVYGKRDTKVITAAILGLNSADPRAMAIDTPDTLKIMNSPKDWEGTAFTLEVRGSGRFDPKRPDREFLDCVPCALPVPRRVPLQGDVSAEQAPQTPPPAASAAPSAPAFPPPGWTPHPTAGWFYRGQEVVSEADLRARAAAGTA